MRWLRGWGGELEVRVEAAAYRGRPIYFRLFGEWSRPWRMTPYEPTTGQRIASGLMGGLLLIPIGIAKCFELAMNDGMYMINLSNMLLFFFHQLMVLCKNFLLVIL